MRRRTVVGVVAIAALLVLVIAPIATARSAITYHGTIDHAVCLSGGPIGTVTGTWNVNVTRAGGKVTYAMFQDGKVHAVVTPASGWTRTTGGAPWVFEQSFGTDVGASVTISESPVTWTLHVWGAPGCTDFWAYGSGFAA